MPSVKQFTKLGVERLTLPEGKTQVSYFQTLDRGLALVLVVGRTTKTWRCMTYADNGKAQSFKLGRFPQVQPDEARKQARAHFEDPKARARTEVGTFKDVAENWIKRHVEPKRLRSQKEIERVLKNYVYPRWGKRPFLEVRRREVNDLLDEVADKNGLRQANSVLAVIRGVMSWHQTRDEDYVSPIVRGMKRVHAKARERILTDDEIRAVWATSENVGTFDALVRFALLVGQRRDKIATMRWTDVKDGVWTIPAEAREKGTAGVLVLPEQALAIIADQKQRQDDAEKDTEFVFHGRGKVAFNAFSQGKAELDALLPEDMPHWVIHDLRRTARSLLSRAGVRPDIAERVLGHAIPGVEGVYDRHQYTDEKAQALKALASMIDRILDPIAGDNVVPIKAAG